MSLTAVPSARNSGFERTSKRTPSFREFRILSMASAVFTGKVLFSTTIFGERACSRIWRAVFSQY